MKKIVLHLRTNNDTNGNPRRLFLVFDPTTGGVLHGYDEGYSGRSVFKADYPDTVELGTFDIVPGEYRNIKKQLSQAGKLTHG